MREGRSVSPRATVGGIGTGTPGRGDWSEPLGVFKFVRRDHVRGSGHGVAPWPRGAWEAGLWGHAIWAGMIWKTVGAINAGAQ